MMLTLAKVLGLRRWLIRVPVLTPRLSSYWVNLVTPIKASIARPLVEGLRSETVCENDDALRVFDFQPTTFEDATREALRLYGVGRFEAEAINGSSTEEFPSLNTPQILSDRRKTNVQASAETTYRVISAIGGDNGWYYANWLWKLRGFIDRLLGGPGLRRLKGRPASLEPGGILDFWRVLRAEPADSVVLRAEMKVWGQAWLEFRILPVGDRNCQLTQTAMYYPKGIFGIVYWYSVYLLHAVVFRGLIAAIAQRAKMLSDSAEAEHEQSTWTA
jgi:hypothetical protein